MTDDKIFLILYGNLSSGVFAIKNLITDFDFHRFVLLARSASYYLALLGFFLSCIRDIKSCSCLGLSLFRLKNHSVCQWSNHNSIILNVYINVFAASPSDAAGNILINCRATCHDGDNLSYRVICRK